MRLPPGETRVSFAEAARSLPGRPHPAALGRWARHGFRGIRLEYERQGRRCYTSFEAMDRFFDAITRADIEASTEQTSPAHQGAAEFEPRRAAIAEHELAADGIE